MAWKTGIRIALVTLLVGCYPARAEDVATLPILSRVGPWPSLSKMIAFDGRLWLVNSVLGINHNSADLYSFDPLTGDIRFERHLFSQDAGDPLVAGDLLYWPSEDPRASVGWGDLMVTNGEGWAYHIVPTGRIFHIHAMAALGRQLIAAGSAWKACLHASDDGGATWRNIYEHPTAEGRVSRIVDLANAGGRVFGHLIDPDGSHLILYDGDELTAVADWPKWAEIRSLTAFGAQAYALVQEDGGRSIWRSDGRTAIRLYGPDPSWRATELTSGNGALWAAGAADDGGVVWRSADGISWRVAARVEGGRPESILLVRDNIYVAGSGKDGRGVLWGPAIDRDPIPRIAQSAPLPLRAKRHSLIAPDWQAESRRLALILADPATYDDRSVLRDRLWDAALSDAPASFFLSALDAKVPDRELSLIGGNTATTAATVSRWTILWAMGVAGRGIVPADMMALPWQSPSNPSEKYFDLPAIALWIVAVIGQRDAATVQTMIARLDRTDDPVWVKGDIVGALHALTGQPYGYDAAAWRKWWRVARTSWPSSGGTR